MYNLNLPGINCYLIIFSSTYCCRQNVNHYGGVLVLNDKVAGETAGTWNLLPLCPSVAGAGTVSIGVLRFKAVIGTLSVIHRRVAYHQGQDLFVPSLDASKFYISFLSYTHTIVIIIFNTRKGYFIHSFIQSFILKFNHSVSRTLTHCHMHIDMHTLTHALHRLICIRFFFFIANLNSFLLPKVFIR